jgi:hypothetical protein
MRSDFTDCAGLTRVGNVVSHWRRGREIHETDNLVACMPGRTIRRSAMEIALCSVDATIARDIATNIDGVSSPAVVSVSAVDRPNRPRLLAMSAEMSAEYATGSNGAFTTRTVTRRCGGRNERCDIQRRGARACHVAFLRNCAADVMTDVHSLFSSRKEAQRHAKARSVGN